jgi:hypothetical protein
MTKSIIPVAGIFLACVIAAGIPAVAAADQAKATASPVINPVLVATPVAEQPQTPVQNVSTPPVNTTPVKIADKNTDSKSIDNKSTDKSTDKKADTTTETKNWWENLWPFSSVKAGDDKTIVSQTTPAPTVTNPPADTTNKDTIKNTTSPKGGLENPKVTKSV